MRSQAISGNTGRSRSAPPATQRVAGLGPLQLFTLAFGTIAGIAWVFLTGPWLAAAGSLGTVIAICAGAVSMLPIVVAYSNLARRIPGAGGEILYAGKTMGANAGFLAGWILAASYIALVSFICVTVAWLIDLFLTRVGKQFGMPFPHSRSTGVIVSAIAFVIVIGANLRGVGMAARLQDAIVFLKISVVFLLAGAALYAGDGANLQPYFVRSPSSASVHGILGVLVTAPFLYAGFNTAVQAMADTDMTRLHLVKRAFLAAVICAAAFYAGIVLSITVAMPRDALLAQELPAISGLAAAFNSPLAAALVAVVALLALAACWNGVFLAGCKVLSELSRRGYLPQWIGMSRSGSVVVVVVTSLALSMLGREAVTVTVNTVSFFMAVAFAIACYAWWRLPREGRSGERFMAVTSLLLSVGLALLSLQQLFAAQCFPPEMYFIGAWLALGVIIILLRSRHAQTLG